MKNRRCMQDCWRAKTKTAVRCTALAFFVSALASVPAHAMTNLVGGVAFGTNYSSLATATNIVSVTDGAGTLVVGFSNTTSVVLQDDIDGYIVITNKSADFTLSSTSNASMTSAQGAVVAAINATNLLISGGTFIGTGGFDNTGYPPIPGVDDTAAVGGLLRNSTAVIDGSTFTGADGLEGLVVDSSMLTISNGTFTGSAAVFASNSVVTIHDGSFTGRVGSTAFYLQDGDVTVHNGSFKGNQGGAGNVAGDGLFSLQTGSGTNQVALYGGTFSSLAFYGETNSTHAFLAGTNLVVQSGIIQNGGTVLVDNQGDAALQDITIFDGNMTVENNFTLSSNGVFNLASIDSSGSFLGDLTAENDSSIIVGYGQIDVAGAYIQGSNSILSFLASSTTNGLLSAGTADFLSGAIIHVDASTTGFLAGTNDLTLVTTTSGVSGTNNIDVQAIAYGRSAFDGLLLPGGNDLVLRFTTQDLTNYWNASGQLQQLALEIDAAGNQEMLAAIDGINNASKSASAIEETYFGSFNSFQTAIRGMQAAVGQSISRGTQFREQVKLMPPGANGYSHNNKLRGWGKYYGQFYSHDKEGVNSAYDTTLHGGIIGIDTSIANLLIGISAGAGGYRTETDRDAEENTTAVHGSLYGTYGLERGYIDFGAAYGQNDVETKTAEPFVLEGNFEAQLMSAYLGGGFDLIDTDGGTVFTPEVMVHYTDYQQDAYTEKGTAAIPRQVDEFDSYSLLGSAGMNVSMLNRKNFDSFGVKLDGRLHWLHEFNPDSDDVTYTLQGGSDYTLSYPSLDEDLFRLGIGFTFYNTMRYQPKNVLFRLDFDELFGDGFNSHNVSAKVVYAF